MKSLPPNRRGLRERLRIWMNVAWGLVQAPRSVFLSTKDVSMLSNRETLERLRDHRIGIVRFGDGELAYLAGGSIRRQSSNRDLRKRLRRILKEYNPDNGKFLVALPLDVILAGDYEKRGSSRRAWKVAKYTTLPLLKRGEVYGSSFCFRLQEAAPEERESYERLLRSLLEEKDIIYIGNEQSADDIRAITVPAETILLPSTEAFDMYEELLERAVRAAERVRSPLVLITGGVTATALAAELNEKGILTYDIGKVRKAVYSL